jgi:hypothetical protein
MPGYKAPGKREVLLYEIFFPEAVFPDLDLKKPEAQAKAYQDADKKYNSVQHDFPLSFNCVNRIFRDLADIPEAILDFDYFRFNRKAFLLQPEDNIRQARRAEAGPTFLVQRRYLFALK